MHDAITPSSATAAPTREDFLAVPHTPNLAQVEAHINAAAVNFRRHRDITAIRLSLRKALYRLAGAGAAAPALGQPVTLSNVDMAVLKSLSLGIPNDAASRTLKLSNDAFAGHVDSVCAKLNATSPAHAVAIAMRRGLLD